MILDEVITGFRWSPGGLQQTLGINPDLCTMAKILTGGMPGGAVAGSEQVMQVMEYTGDSQHDRFQRVSHGGTFNANPTLPPPVTPPCGSPLQARCRRLPTGWQSACGWA